MIKNIENDAKSRMDKTLLALNNAFNKIRTGRANPSLLDGIKVSYYGSNVPLSQVANIVSEDARTLSVRIWEKSLVTEVEKAILKSDLGLNPSTSGEIIRLPLPPLTEETRKSYVKQAKAEAEKAKIALRQIRRDALAELKILEKEKNISEDQERSSGQNVQKIVDESVKKIDKKLSEKEYDLMMV